MFSQNNLIRTIFVVLFCFAAVGIANAQEHPGGQPIGIDNVAQIVQLGEAFAAPPSGHWKAVQFSPDGTLLAAAYQYVNDATSEISFTPYVWRDSADLSSYETFATQDMDEVVAMVFNPLDQTLVTGSLQGYVKSWDMTTGESKDVFRTVSSGGQGYLCRLNGIVFALAYAPDGQTLAVGELGGTLTLLPDGQEFDPSSADGVCSSLDVGVVQGIEWNSSGDAFYVARSQSSEGWIQLWDSATRQVTQTIDTLKGIQTAQFSPDGRSIAVIDSYVDDQKVWHPAAHWVDVETSAVTSIEAETGLGIAFNSSGSLLAYAAGDNSIKVLRFDTGEVVATLSGHTGKVAYLDFNADDTLLASSDGQEIRLWWLPQ